jgi:hypothetical protein
MAVKNKCSADRPRQFMYYANSSLKHSIPNIETPGHYISVLDFIGLFVKSNQNVYKH